MIFNWIIQFRTYGVLSFLLSMTLSYVAEAQSVNSTKNKNPFPVKYISEADQKLNLRTITLAPVYDNVNKVYSDPIQKLLIELLQNDKVWGYSEFPDLNKKIFVETYDTKPGEVLEILEKTNSQGLLTAIITKGPNGLSAKLRLYTTDQGLLLAEESFQDSMGFELPKLREEFVTLYHNIKNKLPYRGLVLSRRGLDVTVNAGEKHGLSLGQELTIAQILKVNRHPKLKYLVGTEKEIIGRLKITKVEPYLSFAQVIFEKETGVIEVGAKILPTNGINYPLPIINAIGEVIDDKAVNAAETPEIEKKKLNNVENETPIQKKEFGKVILLGGLGQFSESARVTLGSPLEVNQSFAPSLSLGAEFWLHNNWFAEINWFQSFFKAHHSQTGIEPSSINYSYAKYAVSGGYTFFFTDDYWGPKASVQAGYLMYKTNVSGGSPASFTNTDTSGLYIKLTGSVSLDPDYPAELGGHYSMAINPSFVESPSSATSTVAQASSFGVFATYRSTALLKYRFELNVDHVSADLSGGPRTSTDIKMMNQLFGIEYLF